MDHVKFEADGETVTINIKIKDEEVFSFLEEIEKEKRDDWLIRALKIGILGLKRMGVGENVDYIEKEFNSLLSAFEKMFDGKLSLLLKEYFGRGGKVESLFDPMNGDTPLAILRKEINEEIRKLREEIIKKDAKQEIINTTTLKGYEFEDICEEILGKITSNNMGDELERKTTETGEITGCLAGDFVISLRDKPNKKIVFETKDIESISQPMIMETMEKSMRNRGASYGVFVVRYKEGVPRKIGIFNEFRNTVAVVALGSREENTFFPELLHVAYQWAKLRLNTEITMDQKALKILDDGVKHISEKLEVLTQIQRQSTNIVKATDEIRRLSDDLKNDIGEQIQKIQKAIICCSEGGDE
jgi:hypothetical protein